MEPKTPLPADVPDLPPGRFYRVKRESACAFPFYWVEIRQQGRRFSRGIVETPVRLEADTDVPAAMRLACERAFADMCEREGVRLAWRQADGYVGDHKPEAK